MKKLFALLLLVPLALSLRAGEVTDSTSLSVTASSLPELKLSLTEALNVPFLQGSGPLTKDNNLSPSFTASITPVNIAWDVSLVWQPIAFFQLTQGAEIASGWNADMFGTLLKGIGRNEPDPEGNTGVNGGAFDGVQYNFRLGATLQFDAAALWPGDWHHIVFQSYSGVTYTGYSGADNGDTYFLLADFGENRNGFNYYNSIVLGYQMPKKPFKVNMAALMAEVDQYLTTLDGGAAWGDGLPRWTFSAVGNFEFTDTLSLALICQCRTLRNYANGSEEGNTRYFRYRELEDDRFVFDFYRVAAIFTVKLR